MPDETILYGLHRVITFKFSLFTESVLHMQIIFLESEGHEKRTTIIKESDAELITANHARFFF